MECFLNINELPDSIEYININYYKYEKQIIDEYLNNPIYKLPKNIKEIVFDDFDLDKINDTLKNLYPL